MPSESGLGGIPQEARETVRRPEDDFEAMAEGLDEGARKTAKFKEILKEAEDSGDYASGLLRLKEYKAKRDASLDRVTIHKSEHGRDIGEADIKKVLDEIRFAMSVPEKFIGNGATSEVFTLRRDATSRNELVCAKVVRDYARYAEGLPVTGEMGILDLVSGLEVEGVRAPTPLFAFSSLRFDGLAMEHLDAVNFRRVIEGQTTEGVKDELPAPFDVDRYFGKMRAYVKEMHARGIIHNDLHLRNMMIDRRTGSPRVIDFGKAKLEQDLDKSKTSVAEEAKRDVDTLFFAEKEVRDWLAGKA